MQTNKKGSKQTHTAHTTPTPTPTAYTHTHTHTHCPHHIHTKQTSYHASKQATMQTSKQKRKQTNYHIVNTTCFIKVGNMMKLNQTTKQLVEDKERQTTALRPLSCGYDGSEFQGYSYPTLEKYNERTQTYDVYGHFCSEYCSKRYLLNCCKYLTTDKLVYSNQLHRFLKQQLGITSVYDAPGPSIFLFL
jgi:hypothetical protein